MGELRKKKAVTLETFVFLFILVGGLSYMAYIMGLGILFTVIMKTAHALLLDTVFFILAIAVLAGALSALLSEFGVVALINTLISPIMRPLYRLPGAASIGAITTYLSDNPAIISLAKDKSFIKYFRNYEVPTLCNLGTAFGMGLILTTFMIGQSLDGGLILPTILGNVGAVIGSVVSVRMMLHFTTKEYGVSREEQKKHLQEKQGHIEYREVRPGNAFERGLEAVLEGGKSGVEMGIAIIPGVLVICTAILMMTFGPSVENGVAVYKGVAFEGVAILPEIGKLLNPIMSPLFGFTSPEALAFPITSLGAVGAAMALVPKFLAQGLIGPNDIAVFTAMGMCWSGYLSTHVGMMDALDVRKLTNKAILSHTVGGVVAGVSAHYLYLASQLIF